MSSNIAVEDTLFILFIGDFPIESRISSGFPIATFDYLRVYREKHMRRSLPILQRGFLSLLFVHEVPIVSFSSGRKAWPKSFF